jgi:hypothetical protein
MYYEGNPRKADNGWYDNKEHHESDTWRDDREGRSYNNRRMYMEAKEMNKDKAT